MRPREIVGYRIRQERVRRGWSQAQLAQSVTDLVGNRWFPQTVGAAEQGERAFTVDDLIALSWALSLTLEELTTPPPGGTTDLPGSERWVAPETRLADNAERAVKELAEYAQQLAVLVEIEPGISLAEAERRLEK